METIYFSLGIVTALVTILLVIGVVMVIRLTKKQTNQENKINNIERYNQDQMNVLVRDLDEIRREIERVGQGTHRHVDELNRYVDSRFDKTLDNVSKMIAGHNKLSENKDLLKG